MPIQLKLTDSPSQKHRVKLADKDYQVLFMYNLSADRWSMEVKENNANCAVLSGRSIIDGKIDLFANYGLGIGKCFCVVPSVIDLTNNWYDRMVSGSGLIIFMTDEEYENQKNGIQVETCRG